MPLLPAEPELRRAFLQRREAWIAGLIAELDDARHVVGRWLQRAGQTHPARRCTWLAHMVDTGRRHSSPAALAAECQPPCNLPPLCSAYEFLKRLTDVYRLHLFDVVMQYRAIFSDDTDQVRGGTGQVGARVLCCTRVPHATARLASSVQAAAPRAA